jgi:hypothetical protein
MTMTKSYERGPLRIRSAREHKCKCGYSWMQSHFSTQPIVNVCPKCNFDLLKDYNKKLDEKELRRRHEIMSSIREQRTKTEQAKPKPRQLKLQPVEEQRTA